MLRNRLSVLFFMLLLLTPLIAQANAAPVYMEQYPGFSIAPAGDFPLAVDRETLTFQIDQRFSQEATVIADYTLSNLSDEIITVPMIFPYVSYSYSELAPEIRFNGKAVPYTIMGAGHVDVYDYLKEPARFKEQVDIESMIGYLNQPLYEARYFDAAVEASLYEVLFSGPVDSRIRVSFQLDPEKTRVLAFGFNGFEVNQGGSCAVSGHIGEYNRGETGYLLVLGEDTLTGISGSGDNTIRKSAAGIKEFMVEKILGIGYGMEFNRHWDRDRFYAMLLKQIDRFFEERQLVFSDSMLLESLIYRNNIFAFLYELELEAGSTNSLVVTYPMGATIDRERSHDYVNTFAYILNPARHFAAFEGIDIRIETSPAYPYIIDSSIPLLETEAGVYTASFDSLPPEDLVFSTYSKPEISEWEQRTAPFYQQSYMLIFLVPFLLLLIVVVAVAVIIAAVLIRRKRKTA